MTTITAKVVFEPPNPSFFDSDNFERDNPGADNTNHISFEEFFIAKGRDIAFDLLEFIYRASFWYEMKSTFGVDVKNINDFEIWIEPSTPEMSIFFEFKVPKEIKSGVSYVANVPFSERNYDDYIAYHRKMDNSFFHFSLTRSYFETDLYWLDYYPGQSEFRIQDKYIAMHIDSINF